MYVSYCVSTYLQQIYRDKDGCLRSRWLSLSWLLLDVMLPQNRNASTIYTVQHVADPVGVLTRPLPVGTTAAANSRRGGRSTKLWCVVARTSYTHFAHTDRISPSRLTRTPPFAHPPHHHVAPSRETALPWTLPKLRRQHRTCPREPLRPAFCTHKRAFM